MAYINVAEGVPGIRSLVLFRPETGKHLYDLAQVLLRGPSPLSEAEREIIAAYVSNRNNCKFCTYSHAAAARALLGAEEQLMDDVLNDTDTAEISGKMKALLNIAGKVQILGTEVKPEDIEAARKEGANDLDIHDTVLIAATFSMYNRYVDGLASLTPPDRSDYVDMGKRLAEKGYAVPQPPSKSETAKN
ncbi:MAG: peroxidase-related enzyme [Flavitalea sp.]